LQEKKINAGYGKPLYELHNMNYQDIDKKIINLWDTHSAKEIAKILEIGQTTVYRRKRVLKLPHKDGHLDWTGKTIGELKVIKSLNAKSYLCECKCGNTIRLNVTQLKQNRYSCCKKCYKSKHVGGFEDLTNKIFGQLTVTCRSKNVGRRVAWECKCSCGVVKVGIMSQNLKNGTTISCGCHSRNKAKNNYEDITGERFNRLTVIKKVGRKWLCKCDCGNEHITRSTSLKDGRVKSCGCYAIEMCSGKNAPNWKGGVSSLNIESRKGSGSRKWASAVKKRDNYICKKCGFEGNPLDYKLVAHHVHSFAQYKELRIDVGNGITLCNKCHKLLHKIYGNNVTPSQLIDFLNCNKVENMKRNAKC